MSADDTVALEVRDLEVVSRIGGTVLHGISFHALPGEVLALVGESGSGKTTAGLAALGYFRRGLRPAGGSVSIAAGGLADGSGLGERVDLLDAEPRVLQRLRGHSVSYVPQDPGASLNPAMRIGAQIREILDVHAFGATEVRVARTVEVLGEVGLPPDPDFARRYPHQLSGGQQQRVGLAMAFACRPSVIVLDEPTTGLDVSTQAHVLDTVRRLSGEYDVASVYITHDLAVVSEIADRVAVMRAGRLVEVGGVDHILRTPEHPYTQRLVEAVSNLRQTRLTTRERAERADVKESDSASAVLAVRDLGYRYGAQEVLRDVNLDLRSGECTMLLGESGSGKTTASRCVAGLNPNYQGTISLDGTPLAPSTRQRTTEQRRRVQYVFQSPYSSLNPRRTIAESLALPVRALGNGSKAERARLIHEMLLRVELGPAFADRFPGQLSGGERQRAAIARALICAPDVLVCDEVTSALDVSVQSAIVDLLCGLRQESGMAMLFVTHNVALAGRVAQRVAVLEKGRIVESGPVEQVVARPSHPYTRELIANTPSL